MKRSRIFAHVIVGGVAAVASAGLAQAPAGAQQATSSTIVVPSASGSITINNSGLAGTTSSVTQNPGGNGAPTTTTITTAPATPTCAQLMDENHDCVTGLGLGAGVGEFFYTSPDIKTAELEPGPNGTSIVRVTESHQRESSIWMEGHYLFKTVKLSILHDTHYLYAGPFAALQLGSTQGTFDSFGAGIMLSFKANDNPADSKAFGFGIGYAWAQINQLGDGIVENQPLPAGVQNIRYKKTDIGGLILMMSFHFL